MHRLNAKKTRVVATCIPRSINHTSLKDIREIALGVSGVLFKKEEKPPFPIFRLKLVTRKICKKKYLSHVMKGGISLD